MLTPSERMPMRTGVRVSCRAKVAGGEDLHHAERQQRDAYAVSASEDIRTSCSVELAVVEDREP